MTQVYLKKTEKWINKGSYDSNWPGYQSLSSIHIPSSQTLPSILPEKTLTQIFNVNMQSRERMKNGLKIEG